MTDGEKVAEFQRRFARDMADRLKSRLEDTMQGATMSNDDLIDALRLGYGRVGQHRIGDQESAFDALRRLGDMSGFVYERGADGQLRATPKPPTREQSRQTARDVDPENVAPAHDSRHKGPGTAHVCTEACLMYDALTRLDSEKVAGTPIDPVAYHQYMPVYETIVVEVQFCPRCKHELGAPRVSRPGVVCYCECHVAGYSAIEDAEVV